MIKTENGAVIVEFSLVIPLFFLFFIILVDVSRFYTTKILLTYAAQQGMRSVQATQGLEFDPFEQSALDYQSSKMQRKIISHQMTQLPRVARGFISLLDDGLKFRSFRYLNASGEIDANQDSLQALILLPGESAVEVDSNGKNLGWVDHPQICSHLSPSCMKKRERSCYENSFTFEGPVQRCDHYVKMLTRRYPIMIKIGVQFSFVIPLLRPRTLSVEVYGYRERYPAIPYQVREAV